MKELTIDEKREIIDRCLKALDEGDEMKAMMIAEENLPLAPHIAMGAKKAFGKEFLLSTKWDLSHAEAAYGKDWLDK